MFPSLFDASGVPHQALLAILSILNIAHDNTMPTIVVQTQKHLLRKKGQERWEIDTHLFEDKRKLVMPYLQELGFVEAVPPLAGDYAWLIIFGFVSLDVASHLRYVSRFLPQLKINRCVLLTSSLPMPASVRPAEGLTEADSMQQVYRSSPLASLPYTVINVPMFVEGNNVRRPTTEDTVAAWLATSVAPARCLVVSGQPFIRRQTKILQTMAPKNFSFVPTGPAAEAGFPLALYLDELARALYQEQKYTNRR